MLHDGVVIGMANIPDKGNPNVFTTFKGRYDVTLASGASSTNSKVMLTCVNVVQFMGNYTADENGLIGTLPEGCRPLTPIYVPCYCTTESSMQSVKVAATGEITGKPGYLYNLAGCMFNISGNYY